MTTNRYAFDAVVEDVTGGNRKVAKADFMSEGALPVVDQGQKLIGGYTNDLSLKCKQAGPLIVFGDHTRVFKYVDFPFALGADGVKVLRVKPGWDPRFIYHYLRWIGVPHLGYSRHFKLLKNIRFPKPPIEEQLRLVEMLDRADRLLTNQRRLQDRLRLLYESVIHVALDEVDYSEVPLGDVCVSFRNGTSPSNRGEVQARVLTLAAITHGVFNPEASRVALFDGNPSDAARVRAGDLLICRGNGNINLVGSGVVVTSDRLDLVFPDTVIAATPSEAVDRRYLAGAWALPGVRRQVEVRARTTNGIHKINQETVAAVTVPVPPLSSQRDIAQRLSSIDSVNHHASQAIRLGEELVASTRDRVFAEDSCD